MRITCFFCMFVAVALGGCDLFHEEAPPPTIVTKFVRADVPTECTADDDPQWVLPPKGFEPIGHIASREETNHGHYNAMKKERAVCRAGLMAQTQSEGEKK